MFKKLFNKKSKFSLQTKFKNKYNILFLVLAIFYLLLLIWFYINQIKIVEEIHNNTKSFIIEK